MSGAVLGASVIHDLAWARSGTRLAVGTTTGLAWSAPDDPSLRAAPGVAGGLPALRLVTDAHGERLAVATLDAVGIVGASDREHVLTGYLDPVPALAWIVTTCSSPHLPTTR